MSDLQLSGYQLPDDQGVWKAQSDAPEHGKLKQTLAAVKNRLDQDISPEEAHIHKEKLEKLKTKVENHIDTDKSYRTNWLIAKPFYAAARAIAKASVGKEINALIQASIKKEGTTSVGANKAAGVGLSALGMGRPKLEGHAEVSGTYEDFKPENCCDFAYSDPQSGVLAVFDAAGHNNKVTHDEQVPLFRKCCEELTSAMQKMKFKSVQQAELFLGEHFKGVSKEFVALQKKHDDLGKAYAGPALMCGFVVTVGKQQHFVYANTADCSLCHRRKEKDEVTFIATAEDKGLGQDGGSRTAPLGHLPTIASFPLEKDSEIYVFSDGIGEFLTEKEFADVLRKTAQPTELLKAFDEAIKSHAKDPEKRICIAQMPGTKRPRECKKHDLENPTFHDDISLAYLKRSA